MRNDTRDEEGAEQAASFLADDHSEIDILIEELLAAIEEGEKSKAFTRLDLFWARLAVHIRAEHLCLFPTILGANFSNSVGGPTYQEAQSALDQLRLDHGFFMVELGTIVKGMRSQQNVFDEELVSKQLREVRHCVVTIQSRLAEHNQLEENHVYRWVNVLLDEDERLTLMTRIKQQLQNMPPRGFAHKVE